MSVPGGSVKALFISVTDEQHQGQQVDWEVLD